jgi:hypothetical protein
MDRLQVPRLTYFVWSTSVVTFPNVLDSQHFLDYALLSLAAVRDRFQFPFNHDAGQQVEDIGVIYKDGGIALECSPFKVITRVLTRRLQVATDRATRRTVWLHTRKIHSSCDHQPFR